MSFSTSIPLMPGSEWSSSTLSGVCSRLAWNRRLADSLLPRCIQHEINFGLDELYLRDIHAPRNSYRARIRKTGNAKNRDGLRSTNRLTTEDEESVRIRMARSILPLGTLGPLCAKLGQTWYDATFQEKIKGNVTQNQNARFGNGKKRFAENK